MFVDFRAKVVKYFILNVKGFIAVNDIKENLLLLLLFLFTGIYF